MGKMPDPNYFECSLIVVARGAGSSFTETFKPTDLGVLPLVKFKIIVSVSVHNVMKQLHF